MAATPTPEWSTCAPADNPPSLVSFNTRPGDVFIVTPAKAGTTWMQQILYQLRSGGDSNFESIHDVVPWLELRAPGMSWRDQLARYDALPAPRVFKTHRVYDDMPHPCSGRIIVVSRDPRDCCVSGYHHELDLTEQWRSYRKTSPPSSLAAYFESWMEHRAWYRLIRSWWPHRRASNLLWLRYEELKDDLHACMQRIANWIGWTLTATDMQRAQEYCSFEWMAAHRPRFTRLSAGQPPIFKASAFIRKGLVGDYKNLLSEEQERRILGLAHALLEPACLEFLRIPRPTGQVL